MAVYAWDIADERVGVVVPSVYSISLRIASMTSMAFFSAS
jgi:hypothetical protein